MSPADDRTPSGRTRRVRKLGKRISEARRLRGLVRDPDLQAVELERRGRKTLAGLWFFLALGLVYTTEGVHAFLSEGTTPADPLWWAAWTVEPMFAGLLITLLNFESVILSHGVEPNHRWWSRLKHVLLASTLAMNVIPQVAPLLRGEWERFNLGSLAVHAIIPVIVYGIAEVIPVIQARQREIVLAVYAEADRHEAEPPAPEPERQPVPSEPEPAREPKLAPVSTEQPASPPPAPKASRVRLPGTVLQQLTQAIEQARREGRRPTVDDVQAVVRLPHAMAERVLTDLDAPPVPA
ncbi:hypothetical protein SAXI111661_21055 [Saccharomonospora xinjiangensis]|uniref:hypothetical protein n=1 Tax=Saccharomonospora xinjiangensis TaxID=75294 RepID=UPI00106F798A|nr:hypothetical protein [Saccharomonospora xinjiangensis]QBQ61923.1 hypothetical protein EYD13_17895 [Saccharomonospora xinjiangensis]